MRGSRRAEDPSDGDGARRLLATAILLAATVLSAVPASTSGTWDGEAIHGSCGSCHRRGVGEGLRSGVCLGCHADRGASRDTGAGEGRPGHPGTESPSGTTRGVVDCLSCHDHHANGLPVQVRRVETPGPSRDDAITDLCGSCHERFADRHRANHPTGVRLTRGRPDPDDQGPRLPLVDVEATADPADDVIGCVTCHDVHGRHSRLLRWPRENESAACRSCHRDIGDGIRVVGAAR